MAVLGCLGYVSQGPKSVVKVIMLGCIIYFGVGSLAFVEGIRISYW